MSQAWESEPDLDPSRTGERSGPLESLFREGLRRAAALGCSSFFLTEEALRRAFNDSVPREWIEYVARQGEDVRAELFRALSQQFQKWLSEIDVVEVLSEVARRHDISVHLEISAAPKQEEDAKRESPRSPLEVISRRK